MNNRLFLSTVIAFGFLASPVLAGDVKSIPTDTPLGKLQATTIEMTKGLNENQAKQFAAITNSFAMIRTVEDVQQSISLAVESCSNANPDLKSGMTNRFETWKDTIRPVMKKARGKMDKMVLLQNFAPPTKVRAYLKTFDDAIISRNQKMKPVPITKAEDCQKLQSSMDETQKNLVGLITESLALDSDLKVKETGQ